MVTTIRGHFDRSLADLRDDLLRLSSMADKAISESVRALNERNSELAQQISVQDTQLNELRYAIEEQAYVLIATQQPAATDMRLLVGTVSVATNLERMGDHAAGIARLALRMIDQPPLKVLVDIPQMAEIGREMLKNAVTSFVNRDAELAERTVERDREMDRLHQHVCTDLIQYMVADSSTIERATFLLWVSHNLERVGDRATNICERSYYLVTGHLKEFN